MKLPMLASETPETNLEDKANQIRDGYKNEVWYTNIIDPIATALNKILGPLLILLGSAGAIYAIVLGVNLSRAESSDKREEAKKRLINFVIGIGAAIILLVLLKLVVQEIDTILAWVTPDKKAPK